MPTPIIRRSLAEQAAYRDGIKVALTTFENHPETASVILNAVLEIGIL